VTIATIASFIATPMEEIKGDNSKFVTIAFFCLK